MAGYRIIHVRQASDGVLEARRYARNAVDALEFAVDHLEMLFGAYEMMVEALETEYSGKKHFYSVAAIENRISWASECLDEELPTLEGVVEGWLAL